MSNFSASLNTLSSRFSVSSISYIANSAFNYRMDIKQIRRSNMLKLIEREKTKAAFARKVLTDPAYISQILSAKTKAEVGNDLARAIEVAYELPHGWMDHEHSELEQQPVPPSLADFWNYLLPCERAELEADIKRRAAHNKAVGDMLTAKPIADSADSKLKAVRVNDLRKRHVYFDGPDKRQKKESDNA